MRERRRVVRQRSYLGGRITFNKRLSVVDCLVRNLTEDGAKVECPPSIALPQDLDFTVECKGLQARARVIWRSDKELGLSFSDGASQMDGPQVVPIGTAQLIAKLHAANAALRQRLGELSGSN